MAGSLTPEYRLILLSMRVYFGADSPDCLREALSEGIDWDRALQIASTQGVTPLVHTVLKRHASGDLPKDVARRLGEKLRANAMRNLAFSGELRRLLDLLGSRNISAVPFKGPALAWLAYGDLSLREFSDLDLLVRSGDVEQIVALALASGYRTDLPAEPARRKVYLLNRNEIHLESPDGAFIELHQTFFPAFYCYEPDYDSLWRRLQPIPLCGAQTTALPLEDLFLALCAHGAKHCWSRLGWVCDIAALLTRCADRLDWSEIACQARALGAERLLSLALLLTANITGVHPPAEALAAAQRDAAAVKLARETERILEFGEPAGAFAPHFYFLRCRERVATRARFLSRLCFTPTEEDSIPTRAPARLKPVRSLRHAGRVLGKCVRILGTRLVGNG